MISCNPETIQKEVTDPFFSQWDMLSIKIHEAHEQRNGQAKRLMEEGISLFEQLIVQCSSTEEQSITMNNEYEVLPLNGLERLSFIKARPAQYACYRQLDELFKETKKKLARLRIKARK
nr:hypothetical protein [Lysinibacillus timonensis]